MRITVAFQSMLVLVQVALAGGFLGGHFDMLAIHGSLAVVIVVVALLMTVAAFFVRRSGGPKSVLPASAVVLLALVGQVMLGVTRSVTPHVLLGVVLVSAIALLSQRVMTTPLPAKIPSASSRSEDVQPEPVK